MTPGLGVEYRARLPPPIIDDSGVVDRHKVNAPTRHGLEARIHGQAIGRQRPAGEPPAAAEPKTGAQPLGAVPRLGLLAPGRRW